MSSTSTKTVAVLQPGYLPWIGFFDQMRRADVFVFYDDVQFDKHGWRNRNRIKGPAGPHWLTVPVLHHGKPRILDVAIDGRAPWARRHVGTIRQYYARAPFVEQYLGDLEKLLLRPWEHLVDLDLAVAAQIAEWLGVRTQVERSSCLGIEGERSERLLRICQRFGATRYLSGNAAKTYLDVPLFERNGIEVAWQDFRHPTYPQLHGDFVPYLSAIDLLLNCGERGTAILRGEEEQPT
ncbi:MAG: WbqC family protein [Chloroflexota bacterium]